MVETKEIVKRRTTVKNNSNKRGVVAERKAARKERADKRLAEYNKLTLEQKIAKQEAFGFKGGKQWKKLQNIKDKLKEEKK